MPTFLNHAWFNTSPIGSSPPAWRQHSCLLSCTSVKQSPSHPVQNSLRLVVCRQERPARGDRTCSWCFLLHQEDLFRCSSSNVGTAARRLNLLTCFLSCSTPCKSCNKHDKRITYNVYLAINMTTACRSRSQCNLYSVCPRVECSVGKRTFQVS